MENRNIFDLFGERSKTLEGVRFDKKIEKSSSPTSSDPKTASVSVGSEVAGAPQRKRKATARGLARKSSTSNPEMPAQRKPLFLLPTLPFLSTRKDASPNFEHRDAPNRAQTPSRKSCDSSSSCRSGSSPQTDCRSDSHAVIVSSGSSSSSSKPSVSSPCSPSNSMKNSQSPETPKSSGSPRSSVTPVGSVSTPTTPGTPSPSRTGDTRSGSPSTSPKASDTHQSWPAPPETPGKDAHRCDSLSEDWLPDLDGPISDDVLLPRSGSSNSNNARETSDPSPTRTQGASAGNIIVAGSPPSCSAARGDNSDRRQRVSKQLSSKDKSTKTTSKRPRPASPENRGDPSRKRRRTASEKRSPLGTFPEVNQAADDDDSFVCLKQMTQSKVRELMLLYRPELEAISQGRLYSHRHELFARSGHARRDLDNRSNLKFFRSGIEDDVMDNLLLLFSGMGYGPRTLPLHHSALSGMGMKEVDYMLRVLMPETLIRLYQHVTGRTLL